MSLVVVSRSSSDDTARNYYTSGFVDDVTFSHANSGEYTQSDSPVGSTGLEAKSLSAIVVLHRTLQTTRIRRTRPLAVHHEQMHTHTHPFNGPFLGLLG